MFRWIISLAFLVVSAQSVHATGVKRYASIVVDSDTLEIIHARQIDEQRFPASLTKVMTLYMTFDAINAGTLRLSDRMVVSANAARTPPVDAGLRTGQSITVEQAIQALAVRSANDAAVVLAEHLAGSEEAFASRMTARARDLQMMQTHFHTASGLPHPEQTTTARDMAKLATAMLAHYRHSYHYFGQGEFHFNGRRYRNSNRLLRDVPGVDGLKTGFTNDSGYNLIISAERDGRRIVAVVLGGASGQSRDNHMRDLVERSFKALDLKPPSIKPQVTVAKAPSVVVPPMVKKVVPPIQSAPGVVRLRGAEQRRMALSKSPNIMAGGAPLRVA